MKSFLFVSLAAGLLTPVAPAISETPAKLDLPAVASEPPRGVFTVAAVGDLIYLRPMLATIERQSPRMLALLRSADVTFGNLETTVLDLRRFAGSPQAESGGTWMLAEPRVVDDIKAMGFDIVSDANNHATDWGAEGLSATLDQVDRVGLVHAGTGTSLGAARRPGYADMPAGRFGIVAATSTFTPMSVATDALGAAGPRAGVNPIRTRKIGLVDAADFSVLSRLVGTGGTAPPHIGDVEFRAAAAPEGRMRIAYEPDRRDIDANALSVRQAKENSNFAIFSLHSHEPDETSQVPADFVVPLAHRMIDAGADMFVGHGPHQLRGIEIYKGKPIFYSLGNFAMMNNSLDVAPGDFFDQLGADPRSATVPEVLAARNGKSFADANYFESVIAVSCFANGRLAEVTLYPIDLGTTRSGAARGVPAMADAVVAAHILERLKRLSAPFGTTISIEGDVGYIRFDGSRSCPAAGRMRRTSAR